MPISQMLRFAVPAMMATIVLAPVVALMMSGRNIQDIESLDPGNLTALTEWLLRLGTLSVVALSVTVLVERGLRGGRRWLDRGQLEVGLGFLAFYAGTIVVPGFLGTDPSLPRNLIYVLLLFIAVYIRRNDGVEPLLETMKWTLLIVLLVSFLFAFVKPDAALRYYKPELRLPLVPFRFWGVGSSSNSIGPLALMLSLLLMAKPFARRWLNIAGHLSAATVVLLAQSQTAWIAAAVIVPAMWGYRRWLLRGGSGRIALQPATLFALVGLGGMVLILGSAALTGGEGARVEPTNGLAGYGDAFTGRGSIWRIAIKTFLDNPLFGYGPNAWQVEFRQALRMPYATSAHNQVLQALSVGGLFGLAGLMLYFVALVRGAMSRARASAGLAPALLALTVIRSFSEAPLELGTLLFADMVMQVVLVALLLDRSWHASPTAGAGVGDASPRPDHRASRRRRAPSDRSLSAGLLRGGR